MARPPGSFLTTQFAYIGAQVPPGGIGNNLFIRDLNAYYTAKKNENGPPGAPPRDDVKILGNRAAAACGLANSHAAYVAPNQRAEAAAATVLAMSIIKNTSPLDLASHYNRLRQKSVNQIHTELRTLLTHCDLEQGRKIAHMSLKNFGSAGLQKTRYLHDAEDAYEKAYNMMMDCRTKLVLPAAPNPTITGHFNTYFGAPGAPIVAANIQFTGAGFPALPPATTSLQVVKLVLNTIVNVFLSIQHVRLYFGGKAIDDGTLAYVRGGVDPAKIHLGGAFFRLQTLGLDCRAGTIIHELTHTFAQTDDHTYGNAMTTPGLNVLHALSNADNYENFCEAAFG